MKQLIIIRHALAGKRDEERWPNDDDRPLTAAGLKQFEKVARGLSYVIRTPEEFLTSSLRRSTQTAKLLVKVAEFPTPIEIEELQPKSKTSALIQELSRRSVERLAIVGHEPSLSKLIAKLIKGHAESDAVAIGKSAVAILEFERHIAEGKGRLVALVPPQWSEAIC